MRLKSTRRQLYGTRRLMAGDEFVERDRRYGTIMIALGRAERVRKPQPQPQPEPEPEPEPTPDLETMTRDQLLALALDRGLTLPEGYVRKADLVDLLSGEDAA